MICPKLYALKREDKLIPNYASSALIFGIAMDEALNYMLDPKPRPQKDVYQVFVEHFTTFDFNGDEIYLFDTDKVKWHHLDYDPDILSKDDKFACLISCRKHGFKGDDVDDLARTLTYKCKKEGFDSISSNQKKALSALCWKSLTCKAELLLKAYVINILPQIEKVESVQSEFHMYTGTNMIRGKIDMIANIKNHGRVLIDHKTSTRPYTEGAARFDPQLLLYADRVHCDKVGFITLVKTIEKNRTKICIKCQHNGTGRQHKTCPVLVNGIRCGGGWHEEIEPEGIVQMIIADASDKDKDLVRNAVSTTAKAVEAGHFPQNLYSCDKMYGERCPFYDKCYNNSNKNLLKRKED